MTPSELTGLLELVREAKAGDEGKAERSKIARDWCKLWIGRDDYPSLCWLVVDALSDHRVAIGSAIALAERVLPKSMNWQILNAPAIDQKAYEASIYLNGFWSTHDDDAQREEHDAPALAMVCAILSALIAKLNPG